MPHIVISRCPSSPSPEAGLAVRIPIVRKTLLAIHQATQYGK
jgi:hypothetical protein